MLLKKTVKKNDIDAIVIIFIYIFYLEVRAHVAQQKTPKRNSRAPGNPWRDGGSSSPSNHMTPERPPTPPRHPPPSQMYTKFKINFSVYRMLMVVDKNRTMFS